MLQLPFSFFSASRLSSTEERSTRYMVHLVNYLARRSQPSISLQAKIIDLRSNSLGKHLDNDVGKHGCKGWKRSRCLLCGDGTSASFRGRGELTRHCRKIHVTYGTFDRPFPCPECVLEGLEETTIEGGVSAWSHHVEEVHGTYHTPYLPSDQSSPESSSRCLFCDKTFTRRGLQRHIKPTHIRKEAVFQKPFSCPECHRQGKNEITIDGEEEWDRHVELCHGQPAEETCGILHGRKRRKDEDDVDDVLETEFAAVTVDGAAAGEWIPSDEEWITDDEEWSDDAISDIAITTPDFSIDSTSSGSQSPKTPGTASLTSIKSSDIFDDIYSLDSRILADESDKGWKRIKVHEKPPTFDVGEIFEVPLQVHLAQGLAVGVVV
ncbi:hypothetical protein BU26DRAFT_524987 [Trematosphaeria pertusa]|uniref:C2H2-type domain-containing protein n=1 Tax=Trematosphaeria pertusa TaxID=390896 RepID=A0A6A6HWV7_9PLEO|nr:uncharacterized protein BU26DRAFT_524987 [Trematosphaeria pertusa]KAF2241860.1 hypothetical protein BU26DRAFT_524987 [Trematosphaeria pertusa]